MAASFPFSADFLIHKVRFASLGDWCNGITPVNDRTLTITSHDTICFLREISDPSTVINQLNICCQYFTFRVEQEVASEEATMRQLKYVPKKPRIEFDPAVSSCQSWVPFHMKNICKLFIAKSEVRSRKMFAIMHKYNTVGIYQFQSNQLKIVTDLGEDIAKHNSNQSEVMEQTEEFHPAFESSPIDVTWLPAQQFGSTEIYHIIVVMKDGSLFVWQVKSEPDSVEVTFQERISSSQLRPSTLHYHTTSESNGVLLIGYIDGSIQMRQICLSHNITIDNPVYLWKDKDKLAVNCMIEGCQSNEILICKENFLMQCQIDSVDSFEQPTPLHQFTYTIKGINVCSGRIIATANDLSSVIIDGARKDVFMLKNTEAELCSTQCYGVALSENAAYCVVLTSPCNAQKIGKVIKCPFETQYILLKTNEELMNLLKQAIGCTDSKFGRYSDVLECLRKDICNTKVFPEKLLHWSQAEPHTEFKLKLTRYLLRLRCALNKELSFGDSESFTSNTDVRTYEKKILLKYLHMQQKRIPGLNKANTFAGYWLAKCDGKKVGKAPGESCAVCGAEIPSDSLLSGTCGNGHVFQRCSQTLLICCDIKHPRCSDCGYPCANVTDSAPDLVRKLRSDVCTFCDGVVE